MIYSIIYCIGAYIVGGYIVHKRPYKEEDSIYEGSSSDPAAVPNQFMSGFIFLLSPLWVGIILLFGSIWFVGRLITKGIK
jgi:hypothetical protein